jgi:hypothetical protein
MAQAHLIVRTKLAKLADRQAFDDWYRLERLRDAVKGFRAQRGLEKLEQNQSTRALRGLRILDHGGSRGGPGLSGV